MSLGQKSDHELFLTVQVFFERIEKQLTYTTSLRDNNYKWFWNSKEELSFFYILVFTLKKTEGKSLTGVFPYSTLQLTKIFFKSLQLNRVVGIIPIWTMKKQS